MTLLGRALLAALCLSGCGRVGFDPLSAALPYRTPLVIDHTQVTGDLADFPVLVTLADPAVAAHAASDGYDLVVTDALGQSLAYERESYSATPPHAVLWVSVPAVSAEVDTTLYLDYGDPTAQDHAQPEAVWSNAFVGVYHFGDGTTLDVHDSTGANDGSAGSASPAADAVIGGGLALSGGPVVSAPTAGIDGSDGALNTVTMWLDYTGDLGSAPVGFVLPGGDVYDLWLKEPGCSGFNTQQGDALGTATDLTAHWLYLALVFFNGTPVASENAMYVDGQVQTLTSCGGSAPADYAVGGTVDWGGDPGFEMTGAIDEARIATGARSADWFAAEFANQRPGSTFISAGAEEPAQ